MKNMQNLIKTLFVLMSAGALVGCQTAPTVPEAVRIEYKTKNLLAVMPDHLLPNCLQPVPPDREKYVKSTTVEKERVMTDYVQALHGTITDCNTTLDRARFWNAQQKDLFLKQPQDGLTNVR